MSYKTSYRLLTLLAIIAILLTGCGGSKKSLKDQVIGSWDCVDPTLTGGTNQTVTFDFMTGGKAKLSITSVSVDITYKWVTDKTMEITIDMAGQTQTQQMDVSVTGNKLSLTAQGQTVDCTKK